MGRVLRRRCCLPSTACWQRTALCKPLSDMLCNLSDMPALLIVCAGRSGESLLRGLLVKLKKVGQPGS